jgi:RHS repeat-associated protein
MFDEREKETFKPSANASQFTNTPRKLIHVYYLVTSRQEGYTYNAIGDRRTETITQVNPVTWNYSYYPNSSRLQSDEKYAFEYDANGNLVKKETLASPKITWNYVYDLFNRLVKVTKNNQVVAEYMYDESGLRIKKQGPQNVTYYTFDSGGNVLYEQENREYMEYVYVLGKHFARIDGNLDNLNETTKYFYHTDHLGSTVLVTDETGNKVWNAEYTLFGKQVSQDGKLDHVTQFTGKDLDEDTGLYYFNARWYDQETGRFISVDPMYDGLNWYTYCSNNPLIFIDPDGQVATPSPTPNPPQNKAAVRPQPGPGPDAPRDPNRDDFNIPLIRHLASIGISFIPVVGDGKDAQEVLTGRDYVSGDNLSISDRVITALAAAVPIVGGKVVREITSKVADKGLELAEQLFKKADDVPSNIPWGKWSDYEKVTVEGKEYAKVGDRLYTKHAVDRMQPSGMRYSSESAGGKVGASRLYEAGQQDYGRSISPNYVENVISNGELVDSPIVNGIQRQVWRSGSVEVVTEENGKLVVTVMTK